MPSPRRPLSLPLWRPRAPHRLRIGGFWLLPVLLCLIALGLLLGSLHYAHFVALALLLALALLAAARAWHVRQRAQLGRLQLDDDGLQRLRNGKPAQLLWEPGEPLGLALLGGNERPTLVLTSPRRVSTLALHDSSAAQLERLRARLPLSAHDTWAPRAECSLRGRDAARLVDALLQRQPSSAHCIYLRDALGATIALQEDLLLLHDHALDLQKPFELQAFRFYESLGQVVGGYQALWLSQPTADAAARARDECVLVATLSGEAQRAPELLDPRTAAQLLRAQRYSVDALLLPALWHALRERGRPRAARPPRSALSAAELRQLN